MKAFALWVLGGLAAAAFSQGGQGGGFGGGAAGGAGGPVPMTGDETQYSQILTPGDKGEWIIDAKLDETIVATVRSNVFDPALEIVDDQGKVLATNDDIEPGNQSARLVHRFAAAGRYRVWVKGFKSAAGGQFNLTLRRFVTVNSPIGARTSLILDSTGSAWIRFAAKKGSPIAIYSKGASGSPGLDVFDPTGDEVEIGFRVNDDGDPIELRNLKDGDYYARLSSRGSAKSTVEFAAELIPLRRMQVGKKLTGKLPPHGREIVLVDLNPGELVRVQVTSRGPRAWSTSGSLEDVNSTEGVSQVFYNMSKDGWEALFATKKTEVAFTIAQPGGLPTDYQLTVSSPVKPLAGNTASSSVNIGSADFYTFEARQGELVELTASSATFDPVVRINGPDAKLIGDNDDGGDGKNSSLTVPIPVDGTYIASVFSFGLGGSGKYDLRKRTIAPKAILIGESKTGALPANGTEVWSFSANAGQTLLLRSASDTATLSVVVYGPKGEVVGTEHSNDLKVLKTGAEGEYRIWIRAGEGSGAYRIRLIDVDR